MQTEVNLKRLNLVTVIPNCVRFRSPKPLNGCTRAMTIGTQARQQVLTEISMKSASRWIRSSYTFHIDVTKNATVGWREKKVHFQYMRREEKKNPNRRLVARMLPSKCNKMWIFIGNILKTFIIQLFHALLSRVCVHCTHLRTFSFCVLIQ